MLSCIGFLSGCSSDGLKALPEYQDNKEMMIGGWDSPINTLADYQLAKDMGLTHMFIDQYFASKGTKEYEDILKYCEEAGLKAIIGSGNNLTTESPEDATDYSVYPAVDMVNYWDEPSYRNFERLGELASAHKTRYEGKDMTFYANLNPSTAGGVYIEDNDYEKHLTDYCETVFDKIEGRKILSTDVYPLLEKNKVFSISNTWLANLEATATVAQKFGAEQHYFLLSTQHYNYRKVTEEEIRFQFYVDMAYGVKNFTYFTYTTSFINGWGHGAVDRFESGKTYDTYDFAKTVNSELKKFDHVYLSFDWKGTMPIVGTGNPDENNPAFDVLKYPLSSLEAAKSVTATADTLVGQFKDNDNNDGLIVTNYSDPRDGITDTVSFEFKNANRVIVYQKGERKLYEVKNGKFSISLDPGEGIFLIPVKLA